MNLYYTLLSPPSQSVIMTAKYLNLKLTLKHIDLDTKKDHLQPEYLKLNPQHCVPTLVDGDFALWESRAIMQYLANQYASDSEVYPKEPKKRALVDRMMYFDIGTLYKAEANYIYPQLLFGQPADAQKEKLLREQLELFNILISSSKYAAGNQITLADFALAASISTLSAIDFDISAYPNVTKWLDQLKADLPFYDELCVQPVEQMKLLMKIGFSKHGQLPS